jgi:hypothetical protein
MKMSKILKAGERQLKSSKSDKEVSKKQFKKDCTSMAQDDEKTFKTRKNQVKNIKER